MLKTTKSEFEIKFGELPSTVVRAPGRVNIIGEHTDYSGGLVLPFCIEQSIYVAMANNGEDSHRLFSKNLDESVELGIEQDQKTNTHWVNCFIGALQEVDVFPSPNSGLDVYISGDLPFGKGLSSSSALCCGMVAALAQLHSRQLTKLQIARKAFNTEHDFIGIPCGFMDQFTICHGEKEKGIFLNCATEDFEMVDLPDVHFAIVDSGVERELHNSAYSERRNTCKQILKKTKDNGLPIKHISEIEKEDVEDLRYLLSANELKRLQYVLEENARVVEAKQVENAIDLGRILKSGMLGLREKYEVSCPEIDVLTKLLNSNDNVLGARMVGGGFGGCVLVLLEKELKEGDLDDVLKAYQKETGCTPERLTVKPSSGLEIML